MEFKNYKAKADFSQHHLLTLLDYTTDEIAQLISLGLHLKAQQKAGIAHNHLQGKTLAMIFTKSSTRTRVSFEVGAYQLGAHGLFLSSHDIQLGRGETIADTARVLSRMVDGIMIRTFAQSDVEGLANYGTIPVINGLTDLVHPCQVLADIMTMYEHLGPIAGRKLTFIGDGNNMCHSLAAICAKLGVNFAAACPADHMPNDAFIAQTKAVAASNGCKIEILNSPQDAAVNADCVYTDVWASMGQEAETAQRIKSFKGFYVDGQIMSLAAPGAIFQHCLPAHRGEEVTADVIDGPQSVIFDEAENRLHAQKAVMAMLMSKKSYEQLMK